MPTYDVTVIRTSIGTVRVDAADRKQAADAAIENFDTDQFDSSDWEAEAVEVTDAAQEPEQAPSEVTDPVSQAVKDLIGGADYAVFTMPEAEET